MMRNSIPVKIKLSTVAFVLATSGYSFAANSETTSESYPLLHDRNAASSAYSDFLSGNGTDPFEELSHGYKNAYKSEFDLSLKPQQKEFLVRKSEEQFQRNANFATNVSSERESLKRDIYEQAFDSDGNFQAELYAEMYSVYKENEKNDIISHLDKSSQNMIDIMSESNGDISYLSNSVTGQSSQASSNLVDALEQNREGIKSTLLNGYNDSISTSRERFNRSSDAIELASQFAECGSACELPPPPPPPIPPEEPEDSCEHDGGAGHGNYFSGSRVVMTRSRGGNFTNWYWRGTHLGISNSQSFTVGGVTYEKGELITGGVGWDMNGVSQWEICLVN